MKKKDEKREGSKKDDRSSGEGVNSISRSLGFLGESWKELRRVQSPTRAETIEFTLRVLFLIAMFSIFLGVMDLVIGWGMQQILT